MRYRLHREVQPSNPYMITGLPGAAGVAKLSADYIVKQLKAELLEELYSDSFPPYVLIGKDGTVELLKNELYYSKGAASSNDLIIFTGNAQPLTPEGQYEMASETLARAKKLGVTKLFAMAAYVVDKPVETSRVHVAVSEVGLLEELKGHELIPMETGSITGTNGLLFGLAKLYGIQSVCLLSETTAYATPTGRVIVDAKAAKSLLEALAKTLKMEIDTQPLENEAKLSEEFFQKIKEMEQRAIEELRRSVTPPPKEQLYV